MATADARMREMRNRRRARGLREVRLSVPDASQALVRARIAEQVARLEHEREVDELRFMEAVSEFDASDPSRQ